MKISDLIKSLEKIKAKHGDLPIAYDKIIGYYYTTQAAHVTKICDDNDPLYLALFDEKGRATRNDEVYTLIAKHNWEFDCDAVKYYYSHEFDTGCKGNYTAIYAWR